MFFSASLPGEHLCPRDALSGKTFPQKRVFGAPAHGMSDIIDGIGIDE